MRGSLLTDRIRRNFDEVFSLLPLFITIFFLENLRYPFYNGSDITIFIGNKVIYV